MTAPLDEFLERTPRGADVVDALNRLGMGPDAFARERSAARW